MKTTRHFAKAFKTRTAFQDGPQTGNADQWHHAYNYDADNRITEVYTSKETPLLDEHSSIESMQNEPQLSPLWDREARYTYYAHGPLARTTLGNEEVQGIDYVYTLQGWIKGVNSNALDANRDPGKDGDGISDNKLVARDVFGYSLHYYPTDYAPIIAGNSNFLSNQGSSDLITSGSNLYNGNIGKMVTTITNPNTREILPLGNAYRYDQLNRLKESSSFNNLDLGTNSWGSGGTTRYYNAFKYDANGNIETQLRKNHAGATIDSLTYNYHDVSGKRIRNRLYSVNDSENAGSFSDDIDDMGVFDATDNGINLNNNYSYDAEGRLVKDLQEEIAVIGWRVDGKVKIIHRPSSSEKKSLSFDYDAMGHRIAKHVYASDNGYMLEKSTYYILDAQGNVMSTYERVINSEAESVSFAQTEKHIFGSSRLGMNSESIPMLGSQNNSYSMELVNHRIGERSYELSNHLGNVLSVISDKIISHDDNDDDEIDWLVADIRQSTDYSPFGVVLNERNFTPPPTLVTVPDIITVYETDFESPTVTTSGATTTIDGWSHWSSLTTIFLDNSATQRLKVVSVHGAAGAHQYLAVTPGVTHTLTVKVDKGTAPLVNILVFYNCPNITSNSGSPYTLVAASSNGVYTLTFTSTTGYIFIQMRQMGTFYLDDITITKAGTSTIALSNDYRYGFNSMEKDDEVKGSGNSYTTEFRQYDPRLGRWLSIDPVTKEHRSPYDGFNNNPIIYVDPRGDDDYYNSDGKYNRKMSAKHNKDGNNIYVLSADGKTKTLLADMPLKTPNEIEVVEKVLRSYANQVGIKYELRGQNKDEGKFGIEPNGSNVHRPSVLAYNSGKDIFINLTNGVMSKSLSNYHQLKSVLFHENLHKGGMNKEGMEHAKVYSIQMEQTDFKRSSQDFKDGQVGGMLHELVEAMEGFTEQSEVKEFLKDFNTKNSKTLGYSVEFVGSGSKIQGNGTDYQFNTIATRKGTKNGVRIINSNDVKK